MVTSQRSQALSAQLWLAPRLHILKGMKTYIVRDPKPPYRCNNCQRAMTPPDYLVHKVCLACCRANAARFFKTL